MDKMIMNGELLELSTASNGDLQAKFLICPLDVLNKNGKGLKEADLSQEELTGLTGKPVVTKVLVNEQGELDFGGHEAIKKFVINGDGTVDFKYEFGTQAVGYHTETQVEEIEFAKENKRKKCITATATIWSRYENVIQVINRLGSSLRTSWEIEYSSTANDFNGGTWLKGISWLGNCMLGSNVAPAYDDAGMLGLASEDKQDMELVLATMEDSKVDTTLNNNNEERKGENMSKPVETSATSMRDLRQKVSSAIYSTEGNGRYYYDVQVYPYEYAAYAKAEYPGSMDDDYTKFAFTVANDGGIALTSQEDVKMVFISKTAYQAAISEAEAKVAEKETELSAKLDEIIELGKVIKSHEEAIASKDVEISELQPYKEEAEKAAKEAKELAMSEERKELRETVIKSKYFTETEIAENVELSEAIESLNKDAVRAIIGAKVIECASKIVEQPVETKGEEKKTETAQVDLSSVSNPVPAKNSNPIYDFINKR